MERAMIETCEVLDPSAVTNASAMPFWMRAVSEGARLLASTMEGLCRASNPEAARPISSAEIWRVTSRTSSARAERYSSSMAANSAAYSSPAASTAASGLCRFFDAFLDGGGQLGVFGHLRVEVEDAGLVLVPRLAQSVGGLGNPSDHHPDRVSEPSEVRPPPRLRRSWFAPVRACLSGGRRRGPRPPLPRPLRPTASPASSGASVHRRRSPPPGFPRPVRRPRPRHGRSPFRPSWQTR